MEAEQTLMQMQFEQGKEAAPAARPSHSITAEGLAYCGLLILALLLRFAALDSVPISKFEARQALHAWHTIEAEAPGSYVNASSPLSHLAQLLSFSTLGASEFTARLFSALAGAALALTPLLFYDSLGRTRTFVWSALLALLTVPVAASRTADGTSFMLLFTMLEIYMIRRYWYSQRLSDALWAIACLSFMLLLSSPSGLALLLVLVAAGWLAVWRTALSAPQRLELPGDDILQLALKRLSEFPLAQAVFVPILAVVITATFFTLNPGGLRTVGQLVSVALSGISEAAAVDGLRLGFVALLAGETLLIIFALGGAWLLWKYGDMSYLDRFAAAWALLGALALLLYPGARAADAMWVVLPLTLLASYGITQLMVNRRAILLWPNDDNDAEENGETDSATGGGELYSTRYWWVKWGISAITFFFLLIVAVQFRQVARLLLDLPAGASLGELFALLGQATHLRLLQSLGLLLMTAIISVVLFLLLANFWGLVTCLQGLGLGFLWLMLFSGIGGAWQISVADAGQPDGLWRQSAVTEDAYLLRETLFELAARDTAGFPLLELTIVTDNNGIISDQGLLAWLAREFSEATFAPSAAVATGAQIVLMAETADAAALLGGDYVGQRFVLRRNWSLSQAGLGDLPFWWTTGRQRAEQIEEEAVLLWLRQDVYDGIPIHLR